MNCPIKTKPDAVPNLGTRTVVASKERSECINPEVVSALQIKHVNSEDLLDNGVISLPSKESPDKEEYKNLNKHDLIEIMTFMPHWRHAEILADNFNNFRAAFRTPGTEEYIYRKLEFTRLYVNLEGNHPLVQSDENRYIKEAYWAKKLRPELFDEVLTPEAMAAIRIQDLPNAPGDLTDTYVFLAYHLPRI